MIDIQSRQWVLTCHGISRAPDTCPQSIVCAYPPITSFPINSKLKYSPGCSSSQSASDTKINFIPIKDITLTIRVISLSSPTREVTHRTSFSQLSKTYITGSSAITFINNFKFKIYLPSSWDCSGSNARVIVNRTHHNITTTFRHHTIHRVSTNPIRMIQDVLMFIKTKAKFQSNFWVTGPSLRKESDVSSRERN